MKLSHRFLVIAILLLAIILRFINYHNRWGLASDQAAFALTGIHALRAHELPLLGPFSSGGPFQTGGIWYWLVALGKLVFFGSIQGPWLFMGLLSLVFVIAMIIAGSLLGGANLGLISGLLSAVSTAQITQSTNLSNQTPIALPAVGTIIAALLYIKTKTPRYLFFVGLGIGIASAIHLQGAGLVPIAIAAVLLSGLPTLQGLMLLALGILAPWVSVLWADSGHSWYNTKNMIQYYAVDQYRISLDVLGRRWLTFGTQFIPNIWSFTIGGFRWVGILTIILGLGVAAYQVLTRKVTKGWVFVFISFVGCLTMARYAHVPLFDSFVVFFHPFILLLTAGVVWFFLSRSKIIGIALLILIVAMSTIKNFQEITRATNLSAQEAIRLRSALSSFFPEKKIALYDFFYKNTSSSFPLLMYLEEKNLVAPDGVRVGISHPNPDIDPSHKILYTDAMGVSLYDLTGSSSAQLGDGHWAYVDAEVIYQSVEHWYQKP